MIEIKIASLFIVTSPPKSVSTGVLLIIKQFSNGPVTLISKSLASSEIYEIM